jgi:hypothetical protein
MRTERQRTANLAVLLVILAGVAALLDGSAFWIGQLVVAGATAFGAFFYLADLDPRGVPIESLAMPVVATFATAGLAHLVGPGPVFAAILAGGGVLIAATLLMEARLLGPADEIRARRERQLLPLCVLLAFLGFAAVAGSVFAGLATPLPGAEEPAAIARHAPAGRLDGTIPSCSLPADRQCPGPHRNLGGGTCGGHRRGRHAPSCPRLPQLLGPAILAGVFYLWSAYRAAPGAERRSVGWIWEYLVLIVALVGVILWNQLVR